MSCLRLVHIQTITIRLCMERVVVCRIGIDGQLIRRSDGVLELAPGDSFSECQLQELGHSMKHCYFIRVLDARS